MPKPTNPGLRDALVAAIEESVSNLEQDIRNLDRVSLARVAAALKQGVELVRKYDRVRVLQSPVQRPALVRYERARARRDRRADPSI